MRKLSGMTATKRRKITGNSFCHGGISGGGDMINNPPENSVRGGDGDAGGVDFINQLPHPLLSSIISLLPLKEAVASSSVCCNWRNLWMYLVRLDIGISPTTGEWNIDHVVSCQLNNDVPRCRIDMSKSGQRVDFVSWVEFLKEEKGLQELQILYKDTRNPKLPTGFYRNLRVVEIKNDKYCHAGAFEGCENLETLKLTDVILSSATLTRIAHHCTRLENLVLMRCKGLVDLMINDCTRLKYLEINDLSVESFEFRLMNLRVLCLANFSCQSHHLRCPNLSALRNSDNNPKILTHFSGLVGNYDLMRFCNVQELSCGLDLDEYYDLISLRHILRMWTKLKHLYIINKVYYEFDDDHKNVTLPYPKYEFWKGETTDVKVVQIKGFKCRENEMFLACHLIKSAEALEKLVIQFDPEKLILEKKSIEDAKRELSSLERASANASIVFK